MIIVQAQLTLTALAFACSARADCLAAEATAARLPEILAKATAALFEAVAMASFALLAMLAIANAALLRIFWTSWADRICSCCIDCDNTCVDCDNCWSDWESCWDCCESCWDCWDSCWDCCESVAILLLAVTRALLRDEMVADGSDPIITLT